MSPRDEGSSGVNLGIKGGLLIDRHFGFFRLGEPESTTRSRWESHFGTQVLVHLEHKRCVTLEHKTTQTHGRVEKSEITLEQNKPVFFGSL